MPVSQFLSWFLFCRTTELLCSPDTKYLSHLVSQRSLEIFVHDGRCYDGLIVTVRLLNPSGKKRMKKAVFAVFLSVTMVQFVDLL